MRATFSFIPPKLTSDHHDAFLPHLPILQQVLVAPGWMFAGDGLRSGAPDEDAFRSSTTSAFISEVQDDQVIPGQLIAGEDERSLAFFRLAFATLEEKPLRETMKDFAAVVKAFFA